jgi:phospholipid-transporting ATPase
MHCLASGLYPFLFRNPRHFQQIPDVSPTGRYTTAVPFMIILSVSAIKEIFEDLKRRRMDFKVNNYEVDVFRNGAWVKTLWKDVSYLYPIQK